MSAIQPEAALVGASKDGIQVPDDVEDLVRSDDPEHVRSFSRTPLIYGGLIYACHA